MMSEANELKIAVVHDELTRRGGAEVVLEEILRVFPEADVYALYAGRPRMTVDGKIHHVHTSFLQKWPGWFRRHPRRVLPFLPQAAEQFDLSSYDLVISSASGFAKGVITRANVPHISYCHTPTRYLWDATHAITKQVPKWQKPAAYALLHTLRLADYAGAQRVDKFLANSNWTAQRIKQTYNRTSKVLYPPVDTVFFRPEALKAKKPASFFLCVGRLTPSKYFDQAIEVCEKLKFSLVVVGKGEEEKKLRLITGKNTRLAGNVTREELRKLYRTARALIQPGEEDFGIATAEAQACGTPVIAYSGGGASEIVADGKSGWLYDQPTTESLAEAIRQFIARENSFQAADCQQQALRFCVGNFRRGLKEAIKKALVEA